MKSTKLLALLLVIWAAIIAGCMVLPALEYPGEEETPGDWILEDPDPTATPTPPNPNCTDAGENQFSSGFLRCWNPAPDYVDDATCHYRGVYSVSDVATNGIGVYVPIGYTWTITGTESFLCDRTVAEPTGENGKILIYEAATGFTGGADSGLSPGALVAEVSAFVCSYDAGSRAFSGSAAAAIPTPVVLQGNQYYWVMNYAPDGVADVLSGEPYSTSCGGTYWTRPTWLANNNVYCYRDDPGDSWLCDTVANTGYLTVPFALYGSEATVTPTPEVATPTPHVWITEILARPLSDWNLRGGAGNNDQYVELGTASGQSLGGYQIKVYEGTPTP